MSWQEVSLVFIFAISILIWRAISLLSAVKIESAVKEKLSAVFDDLRILNNRTKVLEDNQITMLKTVDDAKKLLSQNSLQNITGFASGFGRTPKT